MPAPLIPARHQPPLPLDRFVRDEAPADDAIELDVLFVGAGPAGLAGAIELSRLAERAGAPLEIGILEKSGSLGEHCLSGAVVDPGPFRELFPDLDESELPFRGRVPGDRVYVLTERGKLRIPTPPSMRNHGHHVASLCEIVRWMGERAETAGVNLFTGFPADALLVQGRRVVGVRTTAAGLDRNGEPGGGYVPPTDVKAKVTVLSEGTRGPLARAFLDWQGIGSPNPQIYAIGVKELWESPNVPDAVIHTMGWPLPRDAFGGSFVYPMGENLISLGLVVGMDYRQHSTDTHLLLQRLKSHPLIAPHLEGGQIVEWGAKTIPEGGFHSLPERLHGDGALVVGDAAGFVNVAALKGIHLAVQSGMLAARAIHRALERDDTSAGALASYDEMIRESSIRRDLYRTRNMRLAFKKGFFLGGVRAALMDLTGGALSGARIPVVSDADEPKDVTPAGDGSAGLSKVDAVFHSGNATRDDIPSHLLAGDAIPEAAGELYRHMCPAGVYEWQDGALTVNAPNCIDCKATDILGPRWTPREGGSGPSYKRM